LNSAKAQEANIINNDSVRIENKNYLSDHEKVSRNFYKLEDILYDPDELLNERTNFEYDPYDSCFFYWQNPDETFRRGKGNCSDKSIYFQDELKKEGIETQLIYGKYSPKDYWKHMWLEGKLDGKDCIIECSGNGKIIDKDSLENVPGNKLYRKNNVNIEYVTKEMRDYYDRNKEVLDIKGFEDLQKILPLLTSPEFSPYFLDSTFLKTLPQKN
jgi:hypothetical protein